MLDLLVNRDSLQQTDNCVIQTTFLIKLYYDSLEFNTSVKFTVLKS